MKRLGYGPVAIALGMMVASLPVTATEAPEIVIDPTRLEPTVLRATTEQRVTFVNRSGRPVHVEFHADGGQHHVFQVPGSIWAVFHRPGRHSYVVHFQVGRGPDLSGAVDVEAGQVAGPGVRPDAPAVRRRRGGGGVLGVLQAFGDGAFPARFPVGPQADQQDAGAVDHQSPGRPLVLGLHPGSSGPGSQFAVSGSPAPPQGRAAGSTPTDSRAAVQIPSGLRAKIRSSRTGAVSQSLRRISSTSCPSFQPA